MDEKEFIIDTSFGGYTFVGAQYGKFKTVEGGMRDYCNIYVLCPPPSSSGFRYSFGLKADKLSCDSPDVFSGLKPGDRIQVSFNRYGRVQAVGKVEKTADLQRHNKVMSQLPRQVREVPASALVLEV